MLMNNSLTKKEENDFGKRPRVASEIYELCRLLSEQRKDMDGSSSENVSKISSSEPPKSNEFQKQKILKISSPKRNVNLINTNRLNSIPFDKQKHPNSPASLHSELLIGNSDAQNIDSHVSFGSSVNDPLANKSNNVPIESNAKSIPLEVKERVQTSKECIRSKNSYPSINKSNNVPIKSNTKTPFISSSNRESGSQIRGTINSLGNRKSLVSNHCNNIKHDTVLKNDQLSSDLQLLPETFLELESPNGVQRSVFNCSKILADLHKLFDENHCSQGNQKTFPFNSMESSDEIFQKNDSLCETPLCNSDKSENQLEELKSNGEQVLHTTKTECKFTSFNVSLRLQNQGQQKYEERNLNQKQASRLSTFCNAGTTGKVDKSCFFVQTTWVGRKCKSNVHIQHETNLMQEVKFLTDHSSKSTPLGSNSSNLKSTSRLESSKPRSIPTFLDCKLPAKVSVLLLNGPVRMNCTENISGKSQEILICTSDIIEDVTRRYKNIQQQDIVKALLSRSRPYVGKPVHIIFEPVKATKITSSVDSGTGNPVPLHPSPAKINLLAGKPEVNLPIDCQANDETDSDRTLCCNSGNSSDETIVRKQNAKHNLLALKPKLKSTIDFQSKDETATDKVSCSSSSKALVRKQSAKSNFMIKKPKLAPTIHCQPNNKRALCSIIHETLVKKEKAKAKYLVKKPKNASAIDHQTNDETDDDRTLCSNWENSSTETLVGEKNGQLKAIENRMPCTDPSAKPNNRLETLEPQAKRKLKIRLCRKKESRTALKRVNVKQIVNSVFGNFFHFYSVVGGHLKSGSVITKSNSILWLREAGVATDPGSLEIANQLFKDTAGAKVVLNIFDYMKFLSLFARRLRMATVDLVGQLTISELPRAQKVQQHGESRRLKTLPQSKRPDEAKQRSAAANRSQSLPNLKTPQSVFNS